MSNLPTCTEAEALDVLKSSTASTGSSLGPSFFFGAGVTAGLAKGQNAACWPGLLKEVLKNGWSKHGGERALEAQAPAWVLAQSLDGDCLIAAAHVMKQQMPRIEIGGERCHEDSFEAEVQRIISDMNEVAMKSHSAPAAGSLPQTLAELGKIVQKGKARVVTTNYDDLIARLAGLRVLLPDGTYFAAGETAAEWTPKYNVPEKARRLDVWFQSGLSAVAPSEIAAVLHLHGWYGRAESLIIDPVSYYKAGQDKGNVPVSESMMRAPMVFYGVGDGMVDDHLKILRSQATNGEPETLEKSHLWILLEKEYHERGPFWLKNLGGKAPCRVLTVKGFPEAEALLAAMVNHLK